MISWQNLSLCKIPRGDPCREKPVTFSVSEQRVEPEAGRCPPKAAKDTRSRRRDERVRFEENLLEKAEPFFRAPTTTGFRKAGAARKSARPDLTHFESVCTSTHIGSQWIAKRAGLVSEGVCFEFNDVKTERASVACFGSLAPGFVWRMRSLRCCVCGVCGCWGKLLSTHFIQASV